MKETNKQTTKAVFETGVDTTPNLAVQRIVRQQLVKIIGITDEEGKIKEGVYSHEALGGSIPYSELALMVNDLSYKEVTTILKQLNKEQEALHTEKIATAKEEGRYK